MKEKTRADFISIGFRLKEVSTRKRSGYCSQKQYMAVWKDGKIKAVFPDAVCILYSDSGEG